MAIFKQINIFPRKVRPVGDTLEKGNGGEHSSRRTRIAVKASILTTLLLVTLAVFPRGQVLEYTVQVNDVWRQENLLAPFSFPIRKAPAAIAAEIRQIRLDTPPIFRADERAVDRVRAEVDSLADELDFIFGLYASFLGNRSRRRMDAAAADSAAYAAARDRSSVTLAETQWDRLLESFTSTVPGLASRTRSITAERLDRRLLSEAENTAVQLMSTGVIDLRRDSLFADRIVVLNDATQRQQTLAATAVNTGDEAFQIAQNAFRNAHLTDPDVSTIATVFFSLLFRPSMLYDRATTLQRWRDEEGRIFPQESLVRQNEVIVRQGDVVTPEIQRKLLSLEQQLNARSGNRLSWTQLVGQLILALTTYLIFFLYLYLVRRPIFDDNRMVFLISMLFLGIIGFYGVALRAPLLELYVVPVAMVAILLTVIFDSRVAMFGALTLALIGSHLLNYDFAFMFATFFACTLGIFSVRDIRNRGQFFLSAGLVFLGYLAVLCATYLLQNKPVDRFTGELIFTAINSVLLLLAYPLLWIFERTFDLTTDLTLLELSDTNRPLLKDLSMKAPGTFNHVLQTANLAEAGATSIGANALLTRVGALYHDIGKMAKPEYFVENQRGSENPHDPLKPRMSALIISSHVKEGLATARKHRIPQRVQDFIPMHHGTTRIEYFYQKAIEQHQKGDPKISESDFRYPGPKPDTVETSLLMLADSVEAAAKAIDNPTHKRLESLVDRIFESRMEDGQLDESGLTFANLNRVKETFVKVLLGFYHVRVKYPGDEENEDESRQASEDDSRSLTLPADPAEDQNPDPVDSDTDSGGDQLSKAVD